MTRTAVYCRISRDKTGEEAGVSRQLEDCRNLAGELGWTVVEEYVDNDVSAMTGKPRPEYQRLLADIDRGEIDALVIWHPDRLYRRMVDLIDILAVVQRRETQIATVKAGRIDLTTPAGQMLAEILASVAQYEGKAKADRWLRSVRQRREAGQAPGWGPRLFGYTRDGDVIPDEAEELHRIAAELVEGTSLRRIAADLTDRGSRTTLGNDWTPQALKQLMQNARLAGHSTLNGDTVGVGTWPPILTDETFQQVQAALAAPRGGTPPRARVSLLLGLAHCALCGAALKSGRRAKRKGEAEGIRVYRCKRGPGFDGCGKIAIDAEGLEEMVEGYARDRLSDPRVEATLITLAASAGDATAELVALEERLGELEAQLDEPGVPVSTIMRAIDRTREKIETLRSQAAPPARVPSGDWPDDLARRARLVRLVVADVKVHPATVVGRNKFDTDRVEIQPR